MEFTTPSSALGQFKVDVTSLDLRPYRVQVHPTGHVAFTPRRILAMLAAVVGLGLAVVGIVLLAVLASSLISDADKVQWRAGKGGIVCLGVGALFILSLFLNKSIRVQPGSRVVEQKGMFGKSLIEPEIVALTIDYTAPTQVCAFVNLNKAGKGVASVAHSLSIFTEARAAATIQLGIWLAQTLSLPLKVKVSDESVVDPFTRLQVGELLTQLKSRN